MRPRLCKVLILQEINLAVSVVVVRATERFSYFVKYFSILLAVNFGPVPKAYTMPPACEIKIVCGLLGAIGVKQRNTCIFSGLQKSLAIRRRTLQRFRRKIVNCVGIVQVFPVFFIATMLPKKDGSKLATYTLVFFHHGFFLLF